MNEVLANLYQVTGDPAHLTTAQYFDHAEIFDPLAREHRRARRLPRQHPDPQGARRDPRVPRDRHDPVPRHRRELLDASSSSGHTYAIGGNSNGEYFKAPGRIAARAVRQHLRVLQHLQHAQADPAALPHRPRPAPSYFDFHEKALYNHLLGAQNPNSAHGHHSYYVPLRPGGIKTYSNDYNDFTCCHGTGMETNTKHGDSIYFHSGDDAVRQPLHPVRAHLAGPRHHGPAGHHVPGDRRPPGSRSPARARSTCASASRPGRPAHSSGSTASAQPATTRAATRGSTGPGRAGTSST